MSTAVQIGYIIVSVLIIILVLAQKAKDNGFSTMSGASSDNGREVGKNFEKKLQNWTTWLVVIYIIASIGFTFGQVVPMPGQAEDVADDIYEDDAVVEGQVEDDGLEINSEDLEEVKE